MCALQHQSCVSFPMRFLRARILLHIQMRYGSANLEKHADRRIFAVVKTYLSVVLLKADFSHAVCVAAANIQSRYAL